MGELKHEISFQGSGLDSDSAQEFFQPGDGKVRRNIYYPPDSNGIIENALGNALKDHGYTHDTSIHEFQVVGYVNDTENRKSYYFIIGDTVDGSPRYLNSLIEVSHGSALTFDKVLFDEGELELEAGKYIKDCQLVDGWIYYNGGTNGLKKINITFGKVFSDTDAWVSGDPYTSSDIVRVRDGRTYQANTNTSGTVDPRNSGNWDVYTDYTYPCDSSGDLEGISLDLMNVPPTAPITFAYKADAAVLKNSLRKKVFQFTYRYKFRDHGYSKTAPFSLLALPPDEETIQGEIENDITMNNYLELSFQSGNLGVVEWVELYVREQNTDVWKYARRFDEGESSYDFYNDKIFTVADQTTVSTMADSIPKLANSLEYITENVMTLGGITEGFDNIELDVTLTAGVEEIDLAGGAGGTARGDFDIVENYWDAAEGAHYGMFELSAIGTVVATDYVDIYIKSSSPSYTISTHFIFQNANGGGNALTDLRDECISAINSEGGDIGAVNSDPGYSGTYDNGDFSVFIAEGVDSSCAFDLTESYVKTYELVSGIPDKWTGFKTGANHPFAIVYYDEQMRPFAAMASDDTKVYVPTMPEEDPAGIYNNRSKVDWEVSHYAPSEAYYWQWFYAGNQDITNFWQYVTNSSAGAKNTTNDYDAVGIIYTTFDINPLQTVQSIYPLSDIGPYVFQKGDRVRVLTLDQDTDDEYGDMVTTLSDLEIISLEEDPPAEGGTEIDRIVVAYDASMWSAGDSSLIEIYRPKVTSDENTIYYATGLIYPVTAGTTNRLHGGQTGTQEETQDIESSSVDDPIQITITGHGYSTGDKIRIANHATNTAANGDFTITVLSANVFELDGTTHTAAGSNTGTAMKMAFGTFTRGDVYFIGRAFSEAGAGAGTSDIDTVYLVETPSYSDFYTSNSYDYGKLNVESDLGEVYLNNIRFSNVFLQDSAINGLSTFDGLDYKALPDKNGKIHAMRQLGDSLRVYQESKTSSVWIGRHEYYDTGGATTLATTSSVLGSIRELVEEYGTINPESVTKNENAVYGFDLLHGVFWRDSVNGLFPISGKTRTASGEAANYKMFKYFKDKAEDLRDSGISNVDIISEWDDFLEVLYVTFIDSADSDNNDTIAFHEPSNRWISLYDLYGPGTVERVVDGDFANWTGAFHDDVLDDYTLLGVQGANNYITLKNGDCRIFSDGSLIGISQEVFKIGLQYTVSFDVNVATDGGLTFTDGTTSNDYTTTGTKTFTLTTASNTLQIYRQGTATCDIAIDSLSVLPYDMYADNMMRYKTDFFMFNDGALYQQNDTSADRATVFGKKHDVIMDFVINNQANVIKVFNSLGIHTTGDWDITDIEIESDSNHPNGMYSKIPQAYFEQREGIHMADFLRNMYTTSGTASNTELFEGDNLRGRTMYVKMENTETDEVKVVKIDTDSSISRL